MYHVEFDYGCAPEAEFCLAARNRSLSDIKATKYVLQYNTTELYSKGVQVDTLRNVALPMQKAIETALMRLVPGERYKQIDFDYATRRSPQPELGSSSPHFAAVRTPPWVVTDETTDTTNVIATAGGIFFFAALMFNFVIQARARSFLCVCHF